MIVSIIENCGALKMINLIIVYSRQQTMINSIIENKPTRKMINSIIGNDEKRMWEVQK